jgi:hypothetical protein
MMNWQAALLKVSASALRAISLILGGLGFAGFIASFHSPRCAAYALVMLTGATMIALGFPAEVRSTRRRRT